MSEVARLWGREDGGPAPPIESLAAVRPRHDSHDARPVHAGRQGLHGEFRARSQCHCDRRCRPATRAHASQKNGPRSRRAHHAVRGRRVSRPADTPAGQRCGAHRTGGLVLRAVGDRTVGRDPDGGLDAGEALASTRRARCCAEAADRDRAAAVRRIRELRLGHPDRGQRSPPYPCDPGGTRN